VPFRVPLLITNLSTAVVLVFICLDGATVHAQTFTVLHAFTGGADGAQPEMGITMDADGNLYGSAAEGGLAGSCLGLGITPCLQNESWRRSRTSEFP
jgi:hypothetical protein